MILLFRRGLCLFSFFGSAVIAAPLSEGFIVTWTGSDLSLISGRVLAFLWPYISTGSVHAINPLRRGKRALPHPRIESRGRPQARPSARPVHCRSGKARVNRLPLAALPTTGCGAFNGTLCCAAVRSPRFELGWSALGVCCAIAVAADPTSSSFANGLERNCSCLPPRAPTRERPWPCSASAPHGTLLAAVCLLFCCFVVRGWCTRTLQ